jgi:hypothetical protein
MPELLGHIAAARIARAVPPLSHLMKNEAGLVDGHRTALYYLGTILPDLLTRPFTILYPPSRAYVAPLHSPFCCVLASVVLARAFAPPLRARAFKLLAVGAIFHQLLDLIQKQIGDGYCIFFPFSAHGPTAGLLWPDQTLWLSPALVLVALALAWRERKNEVRSNTSR